MFTLFLLSSSSLWLGDAGSGRPEQEDRLQRGPSSGPQRADAVQHSQPDECHLQPASADREEEGDRQAHQHGHLSAEADPGASLEAVLGQGGGLPARQA